jgi:hypothetical protein
LNIFMFFSLWQWRASINTTHNTQTSSTWHNWIWNVSYSGNYCSYGIRPQESLR